MFKLDIKGKFRDTLRYKSINGITDKVEKRDWKTNQIQDSASEMIATFLAGGNGLFSNYNPIKYLALGAGANTGTMINWIDHPLIVKDNHLIIDREIVLTFSLHRS